MAEHHIGPETFHQKWDRDRAPALTIAEGDSVIFETPEVSGGHVRFGAPTSEVLPLSPERLAPLVGPVFIKGARPGDVLKIDILDIRPGSWGWSAIMRNAGLLPEDFPDYYIKYWDLSNGQDTEFRRGIRIPLDPFCGIMGLARDEPGEFSILPPGPFGGNMDIRHLTKGATLFLPVQVAGGLFSSGDCHAAQGDGEVCVTGIECPMRFVLRFDVQRGRRLPGPQFVTPGPLTRKYDSKGYYATTGIEPDLMVATKNAIRFMIDHLGDTHGLSREDAYILCSIAVDLKISEVVDRPNWVVSAYLPLSIFS